MRPPLPPAVLALAEDLNANLPLRPGAERIEDSRFVIWMGAGRHPGFNVVQRLRLDPDGVPNAVHDVREVFASRGRVACTWEVGDSAAPADLAERLKAAGMRPDDEPLAVGMVLDEPPPPPDTDLQVRPVQTVEDALAATEIQIECFGMDPADADEARAITRRLFEEKQRLDLGKEFLALAGDRPVATGSAEFAGAGVVLSGGCTLPQARGRGAYRALVAARWDEAVRRATPVLVVQAGAMSRPILRRVGFREVVQIRIFRDEW
jgi:hypothetical protein